MYDPFISVIVASYNYAQFISENINSLINQTYTNFEVLIIDDGSTDNSVEIIKSFERRDTRIRLLQHKNCANRGLAKSIEYAVSQTKGEWTAFCESDDYWTNEYLEKKVDYLRKNPDAEIVTSRFRAFGDPVLAERANKTFIKHYMILSKLKKPEYVFWKLYDTCTFPTFSVVMVKTSALRTIDYNPPTRNGIDIWMWWQLKLKYKTGFVDEELTYYRRHRESNIPENKGIVPVPMDNYMAALGNLLKRNSDPKFRTHLFLRNIYWKPLRKIKQIVKRNLIKFGLWKRSY